MSLAQREQRPTPFRVLDLPAELREQIWEMVVFPQDNKPRATSDIHDYEITLTYKPPSVLAVSRQIRYEASKIFYSSSRFWRRWSFFSFGAVKMLCRWFVSLSKEDQGKI